jgi:hypothetical protein
MSQSIHDELAFHLGEAMRDRMEQGVPAGEARATAVQRFGDIDAAIRGCHEAAASGFARWHRIHLALTALLVAAVAALAVVVATRLGRPPAVGDGDLIGRVVDDDSRPIANAHVLAVVKTWPQQSYRQLAYVATTTADGSFQINDAYPTDEDYEIQIAVVADGRLLESTYVNFRQGVLPPVEFKLSATAPLALRFESAAGRPLEGVEVFPFQRIEPDGARHVIYFCSAGPVIQETDAQGRVRLPYFSPGDEAAVYVRPPGGEWSARSFPIPSGPDQVVLRIPADERRAADDAL